ncbi:MAG: hypothetical protein KatS3mg051_1807 [Anaerolineae bacterium]|nr:MAG: hypothetical protein KatS3mg051_1409 [Anaerolineae bacterium]GIV82384.1 MAG: hypothetical protein KatS3mg051_1738 [Anaerolineae bacterium]GIV82453.1 MAG: hypothetical protein KatS3mg051_1807 [Anaerolineae bacterium]
MNTTPTHQTQTRAALPAWRVAMRWLYLLLALLIAVGVVVQVFFAGAAVLADPALWGAHRAFSGVIAVAILALLPIGLFTGLPWRVQVGGLGLYLLFELQYVFLHVMPQLGLPLLRGLHAVNALTLFGVALMLVWHAWRSLRRPTRLVTTPE